MAEFGMKSLNLVSALIGKSGPMEPVFPHKFPALMAEFGILLFMLANAQLEPIQGAQTANQFQFVQMEKSITLLTIYVIVLSGW